MLQQLIHIIIISILCIIWGLPAFIFFPKKEKNHGWLINGLGTIIFLFFSGLISISFLSSWLILFIPLRFEYLIIATLPILIIAILQLRNLKRKLSKELHSKSKFSIPVLLFAFTSILLLLVLGTLKPVNIDTQLYHLQIIKWTNEYGAVPGLANLYPRLGLGSNLFNLVSIFHLPFFETQNFTYLNGTITVWFLLWLLNKWNYHNTQSEEYNKLFSMLYFLLLIYFLFDWQLFRDTANSTGYDFIVTALIIISLTYILEISFLKDKKEISLILIILSLSIIPFKLTGIFILIPIFFYLTRFKSIKIWIITFLTAVIILTPIILKNYITTGFPLYPSTLSIGNPEWMLPNEMAHQFQKYILSVNKFYNHNIGFISSYEKTTFNWIPFWWKGLLIQHKILFELSLLSFVLFYFTFQKIEQFKQFKKLLLSIWLMIIVWFFTAPDPRFAYGFLLLIAFLPIALFVIKFITLNKVYPIIILLLTPILLYYTFSKSNPILKNSKYILTVIGNDIPAYNIYKINGTEYVKPEKINDNWNNRCFYLPLPCICEENPYLIQRGTSIKKGFQMNRITDTNFIYNYNY